MKVKKKNNISKKQPTGTREWASSNVNLISGCSHNCRYCYAKKMAVRFGRKTKDTWKIMELDKNKVNKRYQKRKGRVMFPSSHDIVPEYKEECFEVLQKLLESGNFVLITSKPHYDVIKDLCSRFEEYKDLIQFRFTITSINNVLLEFWESGAPLFEERLKALEHAFNQGFKTSVSIEPFLDEDPSLLVEKIQPFVTGTIWIGKMNYLKSNNFTHKEKKFYDEIRDNISWENIEKIVNSLRKNRKIRWKDSIKKISMQYGIDLPSYQTPQVKN